MNKTGWMLVLGGIVVAIVGVALALDRLWDNHAPAGWAVGASAVTTFVGFMAIEGVEPLTTARIRTAITATFVVSYFVLLGFVAFLSQPSEGVQEASEVGNTLITNFTVLMGVVVAFYFGSAALEKVAQINATASNPNAADAIAAAAND